MSELREESGKRENCKRSLRKRGRGGAYRASVRGASGRGKRRSPKFLSLTRLGRRAGCNEYGSWEMENALDFCWSSQAAL